MIEKSHRNSLKPGHRLHWYEIKEILGQGGFGITYLAHDTNLKKDVAIKEYLPVELAVRERDFSVHPVTEDRGHQFQWGLSRFISEAQTLARFEHPNIVRVLSVFEENNTGYMVMPYEQGQSLQQVLSREKTLDENTLLQILCPILAGLEQVHAAGFIHRDIKPDNIFIRHDGSPVLLDFGSARQALGEETKTLTSLVSPGYAPFEQYFSKSDEQGPWTDIYGLGATLYRAIAGIAPMDAVDRSRAIHEAGHDVLVTAVEVGAGRYSESFLRAVDHALQFRKQDRPQNIGLWKQEFIGSAKSRTTITPRSTRTPWTDADTEIAGSKQPKKLAVSTVVLAFVLIAGMALFLFRHELGETALTLIPDTGAELRYQQQEEKMRRHLVEVQQQMAEQKARLAEQATIRQQLALADEHFNASRFIAPVGRNALEIYLQLLETDPQQADALDGRERIFQHYLNDAENLSIEGDFDGAESALQRAEVIKPGSTTVQLARVAVSDAKVEAGRRQQEAELKQQAALEKKRQLEQARQTELERKRLEEERTRLEREKVAALEAEKIRQAEDENQRLAREQQQQYDSHMGRADSLMEEESYSAAIHAYQQALKVFPGNARAEQGITDANRYISACTEIVGKWAVAPNGITWKIFPDNTVHGAWLIFSATGNWECLSAKKREFVTRWPGCAVCFTEHFYLSDDRNSLTPSRGAASSGTRTGGAEDLK